MTKRVAFCLAVLVGAAPAVVQGQAEFEVASIRPNRANDRIVTINVGPGGRFAARGYTLKLLIQRAYGVMGLQILGGPGWLDTDRYDVVATAPVAGNLTEAQLKPMLQALLAERFALRLHTGSKELSGYALVRGWGGPKLKASVDREEHPETIRMSGVGLRGQGITTEMFATMLTGLLGQPVVDKTGLTGVFDINVGWTEQTDQNTSRLSEPVGSTPFTALEDQLGLRLFVEKVTVQILYVDGAEKASEN